MEPPGPLQQRLRVGGSPGWQPSPHGLVRCEPTCRSGRSLQRDSASGPSPDPSAHPTWPGFGPDLFFLTKQLGAIASSSSGCLGKTARLVPLSDSLACPPLFVPLTVSAVRRLITRVDAERPPQAPRPRSDALWACVHTWMGPLAQPGPRPLHVLCFLLRAGATAGMSSIPGLLPAAPARNWELTGICHPAQDDVSPGLWPDTGDKSSEYRVEAGFPGGVWRSLTKASPDCR